MKHRKSSALMRNFFVTLVIGVGLGTFGTTAHAGSVNVKIVSADGQDFCMDASLDHREQDGDPVYIFRCHGRENQRWTISRSLNGQSAVIGLGGFCLDVRGEHSKANGTPVQLWMCHFGENQRFNLTPDGHLKEQVSGKCLLVTALKDRAPVVLDSCTNEPGQRWRFEP